MRILIDADGCPVVRQTVRLAAQYQLPCLILCDTAHRIRYPDAQTIVCDKGADSVDFALANQVSPGDVVVTQDYGLAAMCLGRGAKVLNQDGLHYTDENIDALLFSRYAAKKLRLAGGRLKGPPKRTAQQDQSFAEALTQLIEAGVSRSEKT